MTVFKLDELSQTCRALEPMVKINVSPTPRLAALNHWLGDASQQISVRLSTRLSAKLLSRHCERWQLTRQSRGPTEFRRVSIVTALHRARDSNNGPQTVQKPILRTKSNNFYYFELGEFHHVRCRCGRTKWNWAVDAIETGSVQTPSVTGHREKCSLWYIYSVGFSSGWVF